MTKDGVPKPMLNALTIDVEDYFQVAAFADVVDRADWDKFESRVDANTNSLLQLLDETGIHATFFVLGWVAERNGDLIKRIAGLGHEIACHGFSHQLVYNQTVEEFRDETRRAKAVLEDLCGVAVNGYRASTYSVTRNTLWALDVISELGFTYDSSVFPVRHDLYGIPNAPRFPHKVRRNGHATLLEFPVSTVRWLGQNWPCSGGGYFRLFPYQLTSAALSTINRADGQPFVFYLHPWEIDESQPRINGRWTSRFRHYLNLRRTRGRLRRLLSDFRFGAMATVIDEYFASAPAVDY